MTNQFEKNMFIVHFGEDGAITFSSVKATMITIPGFEVFKFFAFEQYNYLINISEYSTGYKICEAPTMDIALGIAKTNLNNVGIDGFAAKIKDAMAKIKIPANT